MMVMEKISSTQRQEQEQVRRHGVSVSECLPSANDVIHPASEIFSLLISKITPLLFKKFLTYRKENK